MKKHENGMLGVCPKCRSAVSKIWCVDSRRKKQWDQWGLWGLWGLWEAAVQNESNCCPK
ncbi:MAG: hypothetical protein WC721_21310 [Victivallaceae bacterium]